MIKTSQVEHCNCDAYVMSFPETEVSLQLVCCSIRLVGLQHSLYEHPVRVEISAPSERSVTFACIYTTMYNATGTMHAHLLPD